MQLLGWLSPRRVKQALRYAAYALLLAWLGSLLAVWLVARVDPPLWSWRIARAISPPAPIAKVRHRWVPLTRISPELQLAVIAAEDQRFTRHHGFDFDAIMAAFWRNWQTDQLIGGSTLSQQTAKNLFLWQSKSYARKLVEAWFTWLMEKSWPKARIFEVYLNIAEFAPGVYGAEAAAQFFYNKPAAKLTRLEASQLAAVLPNPWRYRASPPSSYVVKKSAWIRRQMQQLGYGWLKPLQVPARALTGEVI
ncbi:MAG: monofunctional biosynthetic peptidoglycan transglycosylase [Aeromonas sp.]